MANSRINGVLAVSRSFGDPQHKASDAFVRTFGLYEDRRVKEKDEEQKTVLNLHFRPEYEPAYPRLSLIMMASTFGGHRFRHREARLQHLARHVLAEGIPLA